MSAAAHLDSADLRHVEDWVFDLDNTLYDSAADLFAQIDTRMADYVARLLSVDLVEAKRLQKLYYAEHGTTLAGLMRLHHIDPHDYLDYVHDIDVSVLAADTRLAAAIARLPGRRFVFTNGSHAHATRVVERLGLSHLFEDIFDIAAAGFTPKPHADSFTRLMDRHGIAAQSAALFEDMPRNLEAAHTLGFTTILVASAKDWSHEPVGARPAGLDFRPAYAGHVTADLAGFLENASLRDKSGRS